MSAQTFPVEVPVLKVVQPLGEFFAAVLPAELLLEVSYSDPLRIIGFTDSGDYQLRGSQRKVIQERLKQIGRFIDTVEAAFPNSIILAANYNEGGELEEDESLRWSVRLKAKDSCVGTLIIPTTAKLAAIVDGQHRLYGFLNANEPDRRSMPMLCSVYLDLPNPFQAYLFATINYNQRPVDKSQSYELYGFNLDEEPPEAWSPDKTAVFLCRKLNTDDDSALKGHIIVAAQSDPAVEAAAQAQKKTWAVSTATIVEGLLKLFSSNPKRDRDVMHRFPIGKGRDRKVLTKEVTNDKTPLRQFYIEGNDLLILTMARNYFNVVSHLLWQDADKLFIRKTIGIQALFDVLKQLSIEAVEAKDLSEKFFRKRLDKVKEINFDDHFFHASGTGRQRIRNSLELKLGLRELANVNKEDRSTYSRLCRL